MMSTFKMARMLGWASLAIGAAEIGAPKLLEEEMGVGSHEALLRGFGAREIATGLTILNQVGVNQKLAVGLWARVAGDLLDLAMLRSASRETQRPRGLATVTATVLAVTGLDILIAAAVQHELSQRSKTAALARRRVSRTNALPKGAPQVQSRRELVQRV